MGSWSQTVQKDQRAVIEGAEIATSPESLITMPGSQGIFVGQQGMATVTFEYPPGLTETLKDLAAYNTTLGSQALGLSEQAINGIFALTGDVTESFAKQTEKSSEGLFNLVEALRAQTEAEKAGETSFETKYKYLLYGGFVLAALFILQKKR